MDSWQGMIHLSSLRNDPLLSPLQDGVAVLGSLLRAVLNGTIPCINVLPDKVAFLMTIIPARKVLDHCALSMKERLCTFSFRAASGSSQ